MSSIKQKIPERAAAFVNMKTVLSRLEKRGHLDVFTKAFTEAKLAEETELLEELGGDSGEVDSYSKIFKENLKVILGIIGLTFLLCVSRNRNW